MLMIIVYYYVSQYSTYVKFKHIITQFLSNFYHYIIKTIQCTYKQIQFENIFGFLSPYI